MARGNKPGNTSKSPIIPTGNIDATAGELATLSNYALGIFNQEAPDLYNPEEVKQCIQNYFSNCARHGIRPANLGLYATLGLSKQDVSNILTGKSKSKVSPECIDLLKKAKRALSSYREGLAMTGKINPVTAIFWAKNYDGMTDVQQIEVTAAPGPAANLSPDQIARQIEQDIPLEADYTETDA